MIESEWMLLRARRNRFNAEARAVGEGKEPHEWTAEDSHQIELMQRYLTTAERSFYRAFNAMQGLRKDIMRKEKGIFQMEMKLLDEKAKNASLERNQAPPAQAPPREVASSRSKQSSASQAVIGSSTSNIVAKVGGPYRTVK